MNISKNIDSENNFTNKTSEFSFKRSDLESTKSEKNIQSGGGFFCNDDIGQLILESFTDARPDVACYIMCKYHKFPSDLSKVNVSNKNLLHYFTLYASYGNMVMHISQLFKTLSKSSIKKALNKQDLFGNTSLHYSAKLGFNNLTALYIEYGADPNIRNNDGFFVEKDNNQVESTENYGVLIGLKNTPDSDTIIKIDSISHSTLLQNVRNELNDADNKVDVNTVQTQDVIDNILANVKSENDANKDVSTEKILDDIVKTQNNQKGGKKSHTSKKYQELSDITPVNSDNSDISNIARQITRQSSDIHDRSVQKIIKLLKLDENKQEDVQKARNYKAAIYKTVKEKNPLLNNFDRAVEMEKSITLENLKAINIDKITKEIEKHLSEKSKDSSVSKDISISKDVSSMSTVSPVSASVKSSNKKAQLKRIPEFKNDSSDEMSDIPSISFSTESEF